MRKALHLMTSSYWFSDFFPFFDLFDAVSGTWTHFNDTYTLKIVGGSPDSVESLIEYTEDQIFEFNNKLAWVVHITSGPGLLKLTFTHLLLDKMAAIS